VNAYLSNGLVRTGLAILILGSSPLLGIIFLAKVGLWPDPNPNPIGPGLLFFVSFWPGVIVLLLGVWRVFRRSAQT
jgi:hypothetical protein